MDKIFIIPSGCNANNTVFTCVTLKHPKNFTNCDFYVDNHDKIFELNAKQNNFYSWFSNTSLISDGNLYIISQIDPLFLIIPYISNDTTKFRSLFDIFTENNIETNDVQLLEKLFNTKSLNCVCSVKSYEDDIFIKFDKEKTTKWLILKFKSIKNSLIENRIGKNLFGFKINDFVSGDDKLSDDEYNILAFEILSDYISKDLELDLRKALCIPDKDNLFASKNEEVISKRKLETDEEVDNLAKYGADDSLADSGVTLKDTNKKVKLTRTQRMLSKVDKSGMKNISSYFKKK